MEKEYRIVGLRVEKEKWEKFKTIARNMDSSANRELRRFIDRFIKSHTPGRKKKEGNE